MREGRAGRRLMPTDAELLTDYARRGEVASLTALVERHSTWMMAFLRGMLSSASDAEDVFQESWRRVIKGAGAFRGGSVKAYLVTIARSAAIDRIRQRGRTMSLDALAEEASETGGAAIEPADPAPTPRESYDLAADAEAVREAVRELPDGPRQVLLMRIEGEMPFKEIASELGVPLGTALTWMHTATERLRKRFRSV